MSAFVHASRTPRGWLAALARLGAALAPARCTLCDLARGDPVCEGCRADFLAPVPRCAVCALRVPAALAGAPCGQCLREPPAFDATVAVADYAPPLDGVVVALKFGHRLDLARRLGAMLAPVVVPLARDAMLTAVPLSFERQSERGFNQSREIARAVARRCGLPLADGLLRRTGQRPPQEGLALAERRRNVRGAFALAAGAAAPIAGRHLIVIDDVMTSGSTLGEIARVLKAAGAERVTCAVVARTP